MPYKCLLAAQITLNFSSNKLIMFSAILKGNRNIAQASENISQTASMQRIIQKIFSAHEIPKDMPSDQLETFVDEAITKFEDGGFLEENKLQPIDDEDNFLDFLRKHRNDLVVIKYWKRGCIPCLSQAEMYKQAEQLCQEHQLPITFCSVDTKKYESLPLVKWQNIEGTPTIQCFRGGKQVGDEIQAVSLPSFLQQLQTRMPEIEIPARYRMPASEE